MDYTVSKYFRINIYTVNSKTVSESLENSLDPNELFKPLFMLNICNP